MQEELVLVCNEKFKDFPIGNFPFDPHHSAMGEYHCYIPEGYRGNWYDPVVYHGWNGSGPTWIVTEENGKKFMEQTRVLAALKNLWPMLVTGDEFWQDYLVEAQVRMLSTISPAHAGIMFRYIHARSFYALLFQDKKLKLIKKDQENLEVLAWCNFNYDCDTFYNLKVECVGSKLIGYVNNKKMVEATDRSYTRGKIGITATMPAQFTDVRVLMDPQAYKSYLTAKNNWVQVEKNLQCEYPQPVLWKIIDFKNFGAGRQIRFGNLPENNQKFMIIAQHQKRVHRDAYANISCLTAIDFDGNVMWQIGEPSSQKDHAYLTADLPFQVCDVDLDGVDEVIVARNFKIMILDALTGKIKKQISAPFSDETDKLYSVPFGQYAFDRINIDSIRIANLTGKSKPTDIIVKDRYSRLWAYDNNLELLWKFNGKNTGHFMFTKDIDNDGKEEVVVGYHLLDHDGKLLWTLSVESDHTDEIVIGPIDPERKEDIIAMACGDEGFILSDLKGNIIKRHLIGHAQRISVGNYRPDLKGYEICVTTYWGYQGIIYIFDCKGNLLHQFEQPVPGNIITPVNWTGDGRDLILLSGHVQHGGMIDGFGRRVVTFPDDGHPILCADSIDVTGDGRDEILLWDEKKMFIYTQQDNGIKSNVLVPNKYPIINGSNYRGEFSFYNT